MHQYHTIGERESRFMQMAVDLAREGMNNGNGGPFGAVIVKGNEVIGKGYNRVLSDNDPTAHAEVVAIREACSTLRSFRLTGCEIYTSCEPCPMCLGAIYWARPDVVYYAGTREDAADAGFSDAFIYEEIRRPLAARDIPMIAINDEKALKVFGEWKNIDKKTLY